MRDGYVRAAAAAPEIRVADCGFNGAGIIALIDQARQKDAAILALPELCLTGYTCGDLFAQAALLEKARECLGEIVAYTGGQGGGLIAILGLPLRLGGKLYNCAAVIQDGQILGIVPKTYLPSYGEFYEGRWFAPAPPFNQWLDWEGRPVIFGPHILFAGRGREDFTFGVEICEDLWAPAPPSIRLALGGARLIVNISAGDEVIGKAAYRRELVTGQSARLLCGYIYAAAGVGESTTDMVFAGHHMIAENGRLLAEAALFGREMIVADLDTGLLTGERQKNTSFAPPAAGAVTIWPAAGGAAAPGAGAETPGGGEAPGGAGGGAETPGGGEAPAVFPAGLTARRLFAVSCPSAGAKMLLRPVSRTPFVPDEAADRQERCRGILAMQAQGLAGRLRHTGSQRVLVGLSGGLDSTLALLVSHNAMDLLGRPRDEVIAITMPCFGTTRRTKGNAEKLAAATGATLKVIDIKAAVRRHLRDIGHPDDRYDITYENAQARERTQVLMDYANQTGGLVVGTGDLSELALGWCTYNGDHMSMYAVNAGVPKTLVSYLVEAEEERYRRLGDGDLAAVLADIRATPISPELLPPKGGQLSQKTESEVGPYILNDFFLYYMARFGFRPRKIYRLATQAFQAYFGPAELRDALRDFYRRFFAQQFKRSCLPDGPKVGTVTLSPRGDWRMPSDAQGALWLAEVEEL
ncbi:MAG: NAD(+) synthase [Peptococcaceae bacterium]|jgi:NAD+ synthase (glutamine-hydrolysing)|nr:NAD(+) synthase [Peptococcaceae bacterium]